MSIATWKAEFYPVSAQVAEHKATKSLLPRDKAIALLEHSILKWRGLLPSNLAKHRLNAYGCMLIIDDRTGKEFPISTETCALCVAYRNDNILFNDYSGITPNCRECPLAKHSGFSCDADHNPHFNAWRANNDPRPMLKALRATLRSLK